MTARRKKIAIGAVVAVLVVVIAIVASAPYRALGGVRTAALDADHTTLRARIDFDQVRAGLKEDWKAKLAELPDAPTGTRFTAEAIEGIVDDWASPEALSRAARNEVADQEKPAPFSAVENELLTAGSEMTGTYLGLDRFRADFKQAGVWTFSVTMQRRGTAWRVVRVDLRELRKTSR